ncbi:hypothetical protein HPB47_006907 [Ixodes persulcatus]|uniref:Uncharacterized protein n=1 Tax=Ixodes persulcatus TaxID=34615 RepID=A0AC60P925_IXOPE|nr:hypothetical protein HPB47_006907 [Ixodes persulcatus]
MNENCWLKSSDTAFDLVMNWLIRVRYDCVTASAASDVKVQSAFPTDNSQFFGILQGFTPELLSQGGVPLVLAADISGIAGKLCAFWFRPPNNKRCQTSVGLRIRRFSRRNLTAGGSGGMDRRRRVPWVLSRKSWVLVVKAMRKPEIIKAIEDCGAGADEISECWSEVQKRRREAELRAAQRAAQEKLHAAQEGLRVAREKLELEMLQRNFDAGEAIVVDNSSKKFDMRALLQPFRVGGDMGLYLVNFERVCAKMGLVESSWPQRLLSLLPAEVADVLARLDPTAADDYASVKSCLLRKFRLSPEAFRQNFRETRKGPDESYAEFAYKLKGFLESWLRGVNSYEDREKVLEQIALEQFLSCIPTGLKEWIQDRPEVETVQKAADYADEYCSRHGKKSC